MASPVLALPLGFSSDDAPAQAVQVAQAKEPRDPAPAAASNNVRRRMVANAAPRPERRSVKPLERPVPAAAGPVAVVPVAVAAPQEVSIACGQRGCVVTNGLEVTVVESSR